MINLDQVGLYHGTLMLGIIAGPTSSLGISMRTTGGRRLAAGKVMALELVDTVNTVHQHYKKLSL